MKKLKVENISNIKLDFFLKQDNQEIRVVLNADESTWCDFDTNTKSMILYERKNLIKTSEIEDLDIKVTQVAQEILPVIPMSPPDPVAFINMVSDIPTITEEIKKEPEEKKDKPSGKKRGRKKKRGPKPGMAKKKKKLAEKLEKEKGKDGNSENIQDKP